MDATADLKNHLESLDKRVQELTAKDGNEAGGSDGELYAMLLEETKSTEQALEICAQLSAHIDHLEPAKVDRPGDSREPAAHGYVKIAFGACRGSLQATVSSAAEPP